MADPQDPRRDSLDDGTHDPADTPPAEIYGHVPYPLLGVRAGLGGVLMGLANLVPGISGGTMLLAAGVYPRFIKAIAEVSTLKFRKSSIFVLAVVVFAALCAILLFAGPVKGLVVAHRWAMYSLFIGLTLGGVPVVWGLARPATSATWLGAVAGFVPMAVLAWFQMQNPDAAGTHDSFLFLMLAGVAGASAMILPGVSGGYLLLVMGVYVPILGAVDAVKEGMKAGDLGAIMEPGLAVVLPVGIGVVIGVLGVSNLLKMLLMKYEKPTLGFLLGLLVGAVAGLWPFQHGVAPEIGDVFKGQVLTQRMIDELSPEKYPTEFYAPGAAEIGMSLGLICLGILLTAMVAKMGREK